MPSVTTVRVRRGLKANLPALAADSELLLTTDTRELFVGTGSGVEPVSVDVLNILGLLDGNGKVLQSLMPALALTDVYLVANIAERDALTAQSGDTAIVQDATADPDIGAAIRVSYIYDGSAWRRLNNQDVVTSVNGQTGDVALNSAQIPEGVTNLYYTDARVQAAINSRRGAALGIASLNASGYVPKGELGQGTPTLGAVLSARADGHAEWSTVIDGGDF